jgi:hypothetical protein
MSDQLREALKRLSKARKLEALSSGKGEIVFHRNGKHLERNFIRPQFKRILPKAGLRDMSSTIYGTPTRAFSLAMAIVPSL